MTSFLIAFGNKSPVFSNENGITGTKLLSILSVLSLFEVVQRRQRNVQKSVMHVQSCCFANINPFAFFVVLIAVAVVFA